jgi:anti-sigma regulatory factor (Ser/Thr protein kinase)
MEKPNPEEVRDFIIDNLVQNPNTIAHLASQKFKITRQAINRYLSNLIEEGLIISEGKTRNIKYSLRTILKSTFKYEVSPNLKEDVVWNHELRPLVIDLKASVFNICEYGFTEMFNNVLEHAEATKVEVEISRNAKDITLRILDNGIGIFNKITAELQLEEPRQALLELSKGKLTTDPEHHSGEGIFFTTRMFDCFFIFSGNLFFSHVINKEDNDDWLLDTKDKSHRGTWVEMVIGVNSTRKMQDVFNKYTSADGSYGFNQTNIPVSLARFGGDNLVSRSQAKRLLARFDNFTRIILDFEGIDFIGQAFADEIFRVFKNSHPNIALVYIRTNEAVELMIKNVSAA